MNIVIKKADIEDSDQITVLTRELGYSVTQKQTIDWLGYLISSENHGVFTATNEDREMCGWIAVDSRVSLETGWKAVISGLIVGSNYRRQGFGKRLISAAENWAAQSGLPKLVVSSNIQREASHIFYKKVGFSINKTVNCYEKVL